MLHEILLSLSGHASPLLSATTPSGHDQSSQVSFPCLSPPERALLASLAHLGALHAQLRSRTSLISCSHPSTICRTVSTAIACTQLANFQRKILEVESSILKKDSDFVGGYGIVPLSRIVDEFDQWTRRMEWFWQIVQFMLPDPSKDQARTRSKTSGNACECSGPALIDRLRAEAQTGYPDLEEAALDLIEAGELAWLRQLSAWVLYGRLPTFGKEDFFIHMETPHSDITVAIVKESDFSIRKELVPGFVTPRTASSILFIGKSLTQIRAKGKAITISSSAISTSSELALAPAHLQLLSKLSTPITKSALASTISAIRLSLSQNSLQHLLPLNKIQEALRILRSFFLLDRGEFTVALLDEADKRIRSRNAGAIALDPRHRVDGLGRIILKEGEINAVLTRTWAALSSLQALEEEADGDLDLAREGLYLSVPKPSVSSTGSRRVAHPEFNKDQLVEASFSDFLFSTPTILTMRIPSPLDLFLTPADLNTYSQIHSYILSIRRAHLHLTELWRLTSLRRDHPAPLGPPISSLPSGQATLARQRHMELDRRKAMRPVWATAGAVVFFLTELSAYFQGEVIKRSSDELNCWLQPTIPSMQNANPETSRSKTSAWTGECGGSLQSSNPADPHSKPCQPVQPSASAASRPIAITPDPETLTIAHQRYLACLTHTLLLTDRLFTRALRSLLTHVDHFVALITRLHSFQQCLDLEMDQGAFDPLANSAIEEKGLASELRNARKKVDEGIRALVTRLRDIDSECAGGGTQFPTETTINDRNFVPWKGTGLDRLLMKLDFADFTRNDGRHPEGFMNED